MHSFLWTVLIFPGLMWLNYGGVKLTLPNSEFFYITSKYYHTILWCSFEVLFISFQENSIKNICATSVDLIGVFFWPFLVRKVDFGTTKLWRHSGVIVVAYDWVMKFYATNKQKKMKEIEQSNCMLEKNVIICVWAVKGPWKLLNSLLNDTVNPKSPDP